MRSSRRVRGLPVLGAAALLTYVAHVVAQRTIAVVEQQHLLPRWDLAAHLVLGWTDYHFLITGRLHRLLWDLWLQGYWPPVLSVYQMPFYLALGGGMSAGLWSSLAAFVLVGIIGVALLWRQWRSGALLPASVFLALLVSSPYLLAYASVTMTEMLGALTELVVVFCYARYRQAPGERTARTFAVSLTILFFTKYNYFLLMIAPLVVSEWLERTASQPAGERIGRLARSARRALWSPAGAVLTLYAAALLVIMRTGGFDLNIFGRRVSVHTVGNSGYVVLYFLLARLWYLHRRGRIDWARLTAADPRVRPLLLWFVLPIAIWFAVPYPNHIRDFANLVLNRPLGEASTGGGVLTYVDTLLRSYFYHPWILIVVVAAFSLAAAYYRRQPEWMRWLILAIPLQFAAIAVHQTRFPRFLLQTVVLLCLAAAGETGRWVEGSRTFRLVGAVLAPVILALGIAAARAAVTQYRFERVAFENYTDSQPLGDALQSIRGDLTAGDRLAIVGESNDLSPALMRWELGPPAGVACFPFRTGGADRLDPSLATRVLLIEPLGGDAGFSLDMTEYYRAQRSDILARIARGELTLERELPLQGMHVALRLYGRNPKPGRLVPCD